MTYGFIFSDPSELQHKATVMRSFAFLVPLVYSTVERDLSGNIRKNSPVSSLLSSSFGANASIFRMASFRPVSIKALSTPALSPEITCDEIPCLALKPPVRICNSSFITEMLCLFLQKFIC